MGYGYRPEWAEGSIKSPIFQTSTFSFRDCDHGAGLFAGSGDGYIYTRMGNPTIARLEGLLQDQVKRGLCFNCGEEPETCASCVETDHPVDLGIARREHDHRHRPLLAQHAEDFQPIDHRQHQVKNNQRKSFALEFCQSRFATLHFCYRVVLAFQ